MRDVIFYVIIFKEVLKCLGLGRNNLPFATWTKVRFIKINGVEHSHFSLPFRFSLLKRLAGGSLEDRKAIEASA
jgi:hypothetical protein